MSDHNTQAGEAPATEFLDAEAAAHELAEALASLEVDVKGYRNAADEMGSAAARMGNVAEATVQLASGLEHVGSRAAEALDVLIKIGGPEILAQLEKLTESQQEHTKSVEALQGLIRHTGSEMERLRASAQAAADSAEQNRLAIAKVEEEVISSRRGMGDTLAEHASHLKSAAAELTALLNGISATLDENEQRRAAEQVRTRSIVLWSAGLAAAAALMSGIAVIQLLL